MDLRKMAMEMMRSDPNAVPSLCLSTCLSFSNHEQFARMLHRSPHSSSARSRLSTAPSQPNQNLFRRPCLRLRRCPCPPRPRRCPSSRPIQPRLSLEPSLSCCACPRRSPGSSGSRVSTHWQATCPVPATPTAWSRPALAHHLEARPILPLRTNVCCELFSQNQAIREEFVCMVHTCFPEVTGRLHHARTAARSEYV